MKVIVCIDNKNGMMFGGKRQSMDSLQRQDVEELIGKNSLFMKPYSYSLYQDRNMDIHVVEDLWSEENDNYILVEDEDVTPLLSQIDTFIVYQWNRTYPGDFFFSIDLDNFYEKQEEKEFPGSSHEKITRIIYRRREVK